MVTFSKVSFRKLLDYSYVKKHLWAWIKIRSNFFIKTLLNIMKRKWTKFPSKLSHAKENATPHFKVHCTKIDDISLAAISFFLTQKFLFLNLTQYLLTVWIVLATVFLHFDLLIFTFILQILNFVQCFCTSFKKKTVKVWWCSTLFYKVFILKMFYFPWKILTG